MTPSAMYKVSEHFLYTVLQATCAMIAQAAQADLEKRKINDERQNALQHASACDAAFQVQAEGE